mgnify:CR=1 FL=1
MKLSSSDKKLILVLVGATVLGGVILGIMSRIGVPTAGIKTNLARTETEQPPEEVMMV